MEQTETVEQPQVATEEPKEVTCEHCHSKIVTKDQLTNAFQFIHASLNTFRERVKNITGVQAKRVLEAIVESPLEREVKSFTTQEAVKCFNLGIGIESAKLVLFTASKNHFEEIAKDVDELMNAKTSSEVNGETAAQEQNSPQTNVEVNSTNNESEGTNG